MYIVGMRGDLGLKLNLSGNAIVIIAFFVLWKTNSFYLMLSISFLLIYFGIWCSRQVQSNKERLKFTSAFVRNQALPETTTSAKLLLAFFGFGALATGPISYFCIAIEQIGYNESLLWPPVLLIFYISQMALFGFVHAARSLFTLQNNQTA